MPAGRRALAPLRIASRRLRRVVRKRRRTWLGTRIWQYGCWLGRSFVGIVRHMRRWRRVQHHSSPGVLLWCGSCRRRRIGSSMRGGAGGAQATRRKQGERDLLNGLRELLAAFAPQDAPPPRQSDPPSDRGKGQSKGHGDRSPSDGKPGRKARNRERKPGESNLLDALRKVLDRAQNDSGPSLLQRLTSLVDSATKGHIKLTPTTEKPRKAPAGKTTRTAPTASNQSKAEPTEVPHRPPPRSYATAHLSGKAAPTKPSFTPTLLRSNDWKGTVVKADDLLGSAASLGDNEHLVCGVLSEIPSTLEHLEINPNATISLLLSSEQDNSVEMMAPTLDRNGAARVSKLHLVQFGKAESSLTWQAKTINDSAAATEACKVLRVVALKAYSSEAMWTKVNANTTQQFRWLLLASKPDIPKDAIITVYSPMKGSTMVSVTLRVRSSVAPALLANSGVDGLFVRDVDRSTAASAVAWINRKPDETDSKYHQRALAQAQTTDLPRGLAASHAGSLGLRCERGSCVTTWRVAGFHDDAPDSQIKLSLANNGWTDIFVLARHHRRRSSPCWQVRAQPPTGEQDPWCYRSSDGKNILVDKWLAAPGKTPTLTKQRTPATRYTDDKRTTPTTNGFPGARADEPAHEAKEPAPTVLDVTQSQPGNQGEKDRPRSRSPKRDNTSSATEGKEKTPPARTFSDTSLQSHLGLSIITNSGGGNCLYAALANHVARLTGRTANHKSVRAEIKDELTKRGDAFRGIWDGLDSEGIVCGSWKAYLTQQGRSTTWGGELELIAASVRWNLTILCIRPGKSTVIVGNGSQSVWIKYAGSHYEALNTGECATAKTNRRQHVKAIPAGARLRLETALSGRDWSLRGGAGSASSVAPTLRSRNTPAPTLKSARPPSVPSTLKSNKVVKQPGPGMKQSGKRFRKVIVAATLRKTIASRAHRSDTMAARLAERANKIKALAQRHWWLHLPVPTPSGRYAWKCGKCGCAGFKSLGDFTSPGGKNVCQASRKRSSDAPPIEERQRIIHEHGLKLQTVPLETLHTVAHARYGPLAPQWKCPYCPFSVPDDEIHPSRVKGLHLRAHGVFASKDKKVQLQPSKALRTAWQKDSVATRNAATDTKVQRFNELRLEGAHRLRMRQGLEAYGKRKLRLTECTVCDKVSTLGHLTDASLTTLCASVPLAPRRSASAAAKAIRRKWLTVCKEVQADRSVNTRLKSLANDRLGLRKTDNGHPPPFRRIGEASNPGP